jgi:hypothetical protein
MKNYRYYGDQAEILGLRMDAARASLNQSTRPWAQNYWRQIINSLLFQWRQLPVLHDGDAQVEIVPRWTVDYDFYEINGPIEYVGVTDRAYNKIFRDSANLDESWHAHREARLARAQY